MIALANRKILSRFILFCIVVTLYDVITALIILSRAYCFRMVRACS